MANGIGSLVNVWQAGLKLDQQDSSGTPALASQMSALATQPLTLPVRHGTNIGVPLAAGGAWGSAPSSASPLDRAYAIGPLTHGMALVQPNTVTNAEVEVRELQVRRG